ncbi:MAG: ferrous iron transport protein A [Alphaproteobacteria bacterium]|nr:ferrous iron transport protein A [Alphaproteobacteria bacterium]
MMTRDKLTLADLKPDQHAEIVKIASDDGVFKRRLTSLGIVPGTTISLDRSAPLGDPRIYNLLGTSLGLRNAEARDIQVSLK